MAFIDWLKRQHEESERNKRLFQDRPMVPASRAWGGGPGSGSGYQDRPGGERLMVRQPRFRQPPPDSITLTEKDDGSSTKVTKWDKHLKATALPSGPAMEPLTPIAPGRVNPAGSLDRQLDISRWGGQRGQIENPMVPGMMARDPGWAGVPRPRVPPDPRRVQPQHVPAMRGNIGAAQSIGAPGPNPIPRGMPGGRNLANMGMDLRPRLGMPGQAESLARKPRQQMPPPRFVPRVDPSQFPRVQDRGLGTYDIGDPRVQMGGGFDWTGKALRENVKEDFDKIGEGYTNWWQNLVEEAKRKRQRGNY